MLPRLFLRLSRAVSRLWFIGRMKTRPAAVAGNVGERGGNKESRLRFEAAVIVCPCRPISLVEKVLTKRIPGRCFFPALASAPS